MAVVEFDQAGRTYQVELEGYDSSNIYPLNLLRDRVTLSTDRLTGERLMVSWSDLPVWRLIS